MREKIASIAWQAANRQLQWCSDYIDDHSIPSLRQGDFYVFADQILTLMKEEIEKEENPWQHILEGDTVYDWAKENGFEGCRQKILKILT